MLRAWRWLCAFGAALLLLAIAPAAAAQRGGTLTETLDLCGRGAGTGVISGTVTGEGGTPVAGATVTVNTLYGDRVKFVSANSQGRYRVENLPDGSYLVNFYASDYIEESYNDTRDPARSAEVTVRDGKETAAIDAALTRGGRITGKVTEADTGDPMSGVWVRIGAVDFGYNTSELTDANGVYTSSAELPTGNYLVRFEPSSFGGYAYSYYGGSTLEAGATRVAVTEGATRSGVDAALARGFKISGTVTGDPAKPPLSFSVDLYNADGDRVTSGLALGGGAYETGAVPNGTYRLLFNPYGSSNGYLEEYYNDKTSLSKADGIVVAGAPVSGLSTVLTLGGQVSGKVLRPDGQPLDTAMVDVLDANGNTVAFGSTGDDGSYLTGGAPPGQYRVFFWTYDRECDLAWQFYNQKGNFAAGDLVTISGTTTTPNIDARLSKGGLIAGRITAGGAGYQAGVEVYDSSGVSLRRAQVGPTGHWRTDGLPPGAYKLRFYSFDNSFAPEFYNNKPALAGADPITIGGVETLTGRDVELTQVGPGPAPGKTPRAYLPLLRRP